MCKLWSKRQESRKECQHCSGTREARPARVFERKESRDCSQDAISLKEEMKRFATMRKEIIKSQLTRENRGGRERCEKQRLINLNANREERD